MMSVGTHPRLPKQSLHQRHPKRVSPAESVCIRKSPSSNSARSARAGSDDLSVASNIAANGEEPSSCEPNSRAPKGSESARTWFDDSNKNVSGASGAKFYADDDPPFFLRNKSSSDESAPRRRLYESAASINAHRRFPADSSLSRHHIMESSSEDFRGVIDDLTIENRRLRKKLQKYEQLHCSNLQNDKLFEVRVHGLPASKKRRLERTLQDFASSLGDTGDEEFSSAFAQKLSRVPNRRLAPVQQASSSSTSNSRPIDSAYVSMSTSGGNSDARLQKVDSSKTPGPANSNDQNVRSYLQTISRGLLPKHPPVMTEKAKKQLVVKRLEQLFTGSRDSSTKHSQSRQQQEVSQSAANADRRESEARGHYVEAEGSREAKIYQFENHDKGFSILEKLSDGASSGDTSARSSATPDQRPTRPLDLDPSRAQNPEENIEYMKHLGFDTPKMDPDQTFRADEGWVFLNLLISMAQLHTLNVTPDFVRNSVSEISAKFELSSDGTRIRWKGGNEGTKLSVDSGESSAHSSEAYPFDPGVSRETGHSKSSKPSTEIQSGVSGNVQSSHDLSSGNYNTNFDQQRPLLLGQTSSDDPYQYRPIFYHAPQSEQDDSYSFDGKDSPFSSGPMESNSAFDPDGARYGHAAKAASRSRLRKGVDPIIFYNRARFYTDLSKDEESMPYNCPLYNKSSGGVVGCDDKTDEDERRVESKGLISKSLEHSPVAPAGFSASFNSLTGFSDELSNSTKSSLHEGEAKPFEASGIGGVMPGDNFSIKVQVEHKQPFELSAIQSKIVSTRRVDLLPSSLPPPSYAFLPFSSGSASDEGSCEDDEESDVEMQDIPGEVGTLGHFVPPKFLNTFSSDTTHNDSSGDHDSDDSSIDLLAHARQIEPEEVAAREREFENNVTGSEEEAEEMDVDPPASSVVATVGEQSIVDEAADAGKDHRASGSTGPKRTTDTGHGRGKAKQSRTTVAK